MNDDRALIREVHESSIDAFEELYDRYCARAWNVALSACGDERHAADAVEQAFVSIWRSAGSYDPERGTVAAWLLRIVRNRAVAVMRRDQADSDARPATAALTPTTAAATSPRVSVHAGAEAEALERARALRSLLKGIPDSQQEAITLALYGELTHSEIATCLGLSPETVRGRMRLGLRKLATRRAQLAPDESHDRISAAQPTR